MLYLGKHPHPEISLLTPLACPFHAFSLPLQGLSPPSPHTDHRSPHTDHRGHQPSSPQSPDHLLEVRAEGGWVEALPVVTRPGTWQPGSPVKQGAFPTPGRDFLKAGVVQLSLPEQHLNGLLCRRAPPGNPHRPEKQPLSWRRT